MRRSGRVLIGTPASSGVYEGPARVLLSPRDHDGVRHGDVVVVRSSSPAWTPALVKAGALVAELGGVISHTAIVARELGVPCVVGVSGATREIRNGVGVLVDGGKGEIRFDRE